MKRSDRRLIVTAVALAVLALVLAGAGDARAWREPTGAERGAILADFEPPARDCYDASVSTVDERWASFWYSGGLSDQCLPHATNGVTVLRRRDGDWRKVTAGSDFAMCLSDLPIRVLRDLRWGDGPACPVSRRVFVRRFDRFTVRPRWLPWTTGGRYGRLRWKRWGQPTAVARGVLQARNPGTGRIVDRGPIRVELTRMRICAGKRIYTRIRVRAKRPADRRRLRSADDRPRLRCPPRV